jgi:hypothetical protein
MGGYKGALTSWLSSWSAITHEINILLLQKGYFHGMGIVTLWLHSPLFRVAGMSMSSGRLLGCLKRSLIGSITTLMHFPQKKPRMRSAKHSTHNQGLFYNTFQMRSGRKEEI